MGYKIAIVNGANINILGDREEKFYGRQTLPQLKQEWKDIAQQRGIEICFFESNYEGDIVEFLQKQGKLIDGMVFNPAGFSMAGYSILDTITAYGIPFVEVHLSNIFARELWHSQSIFLSHAVGSVVGFHGRGYKAAMFLLTEYLKERHSGKQDV